MTADDDSDLKPFKERQEAVFSRQPGKDLCFAAWRTVAKQHLAQTVNLKLECFRPAREHRLEFWLQLCRSPAIDFDDTFWGRAPEVVPQYVTDPVRASATWARMASSPLP